MKEKDKNIHAGHRHRLMETVMDVGLDKVSRVQALEFILTYIMPRIDTNPLAHRLLEEFGSVDAVLEATPDMLMKVSGMGERSAKALSGLLPIFDYYVDNVLDRGWVFENQSEILDYFEQLLRLKRVETTYIVGLDASCRVKMKMRLSEGGIASVGIQMHEIAKFVTNVNPAYVYLCHNHPYGSAKPSETDIEGNVQIISLLKSLGVYQIDHIIVGDDGVYSLINNSYFRTY